MLQNNWNSTYIDKLHQRGTQGIKKHNLGTSFLVAPINLTKDAKVRANFEKNRQVLLNQNETYIKAMQPPDDPEDDEVGS